MREVASFALGLDGETTVIVACSGAEGLQRARDDRPDAILLDWMMPAMDGAATLSALKADPASRDIPVIVISGAAHGDDAPSFRVMGALGAIAKPFNPLTLGEDVRFILEHRTPSK